MRFTQDTTHEWKGEIIWSSSYHPKHSEQEMTRCMLGNYQNVQTNTEHIRVLNRQNKCSETSEPLFKLQQLIKQLQINDLWSQVVNETEAALRCKNHQSDETFTHWSAEQLHHSPVQTRFRHSPFLKSWKTRLRCSWEIKKKESVNCRLKVHQLKTPDFVLQCLFNNWNHMN